MIDVTLRYKIGWYLPYIQNIYTTSHTKLQITNIIINHRNNYLRRNIWSIIFTFCTFTFCYWHAILMSCIITYCILRFPVIMSGLTNPIDNFTFLALHFLKRQKLVFKSSSFIRISVNFVKTNRL